MTKFIFDLDGTITKEETLPVIAKYFSIEEEVEELTKQTVMGHVPFVESFIQRVSILGKLPIDEIDALLEDVELHGEEENNKVVKVTTIIKKEKVVERYRAEGHRVVFIGDGNNDVEAMRIADIAIASGLTHPPTASVISVADHFVQNEAELCRKLNELL